MKREQSVGIISGITLAVAGAVTALFMIVGVPGLDAGHVDGSAVDSSTAITPSVVVIDGNDNVADGMTSETMSAGETAGSSYSSGDDYEDEEHEEEYEDEKHEDDDHYEDDSD